MQITKQTLKEMFGVMWEYQHAVNLLERRPYNKNHLQDSLDWAIQQKKEAQCVAGLCREAGEFRQAEEMERVVEVLNYLISTD